MNRKGSAMVEAAVVFPVVILSLLATMAILMFLLEEAAAQAELHETVLHEAGCETGTYLGNPPDSTATVTSGWSGIHRGVRGEILVRFRGFFILRRPFDKMQTCRQFLIDERKYARYIDLFTMEEKTDTHESQNIDQ